MIQNEIIKIVITGPESTGKSTITKKLAQHFNTIYAEEYARTFLLKNNNNYTENDLAKIAQGQQNKIDETLIKAEQSLIFIDTDLEVIKVWSEWKYNICAEKILRMVAAFKPDYYLLMDIDLPWEYDAQREYPNLNKRKLLFLQYLDICIESGVPFAIVSGEGQNRIQQAIKNTEDFLKLRY